jgi:hypothetical protein
MTFDEDRRRFLQVCEENNIIYGGNIWIFLYL